MRKLSKEEKSALNTPERPSERAMRLASQTPEWKAAKAARVQMYGDKPGASLETQRTMASRRTRAAGVVNRLKSKLKSAESELESIEKEIIDSLKAGESFRVRGFNFTRSSRLIAEIYDRDDYLAFASEEGNRDMLHKRISMEAAQERWNEARTRAEEQGLSKTEIARAVAEAIPGVRPGTLPTLSVTKAAR